MWWICIVNVRKKREKVVVMLTIKLYCVGGQVLFINVSLHSMCHSPSVGTETGVDVSLIAGVGLKDKVRLSLQGHIALGLMHMFNISLHYTGSLRRRRKEKCREERTDLPPPWHMVCATLAIIVQICWYILLFFFFSCLVHVPHAP